MLRRQFVPAALAVALLPLAGKLPASTAPALNRGRTILRLHLRATREFPEFPMDAGEYVVVTYDDGERNPMQVMFEDCTEGPMSPDDLRVIARGLRDGGLVLAVQPSAADMLRCIDAQIAALL